MDIETERLYELLNYFDKKFYEKCQKFLDRRLAQLNKEIRNYPRPLAHCDQHLDALLEERTKVLKAIEELNEQR